MQPLCSLRGNFFTALRSFLCSLLILLLEHPGILSCTISFVVVLLTLWRIHWIHKSVALICEKRLLVTIPIFYSEFNAAGLIKPLYMAFDYKEIMGVSDDWNYLLSGNGRLAALWKCRCSSGILRTQIK